MAVPSGVIVAWPSTIALIPAGWTRETNLDAKYIQGAPTGGDTDLTARGATTHTHTSPSHTPIQNSHNHSYTLAASTGSNQADLGAQVVAKDGHTHSGVSSDATATNNGVAITVNANSSNDLPYKEVIFIKSDGTPVGIPNGAYAFFASDTLPGSWSRVLGDTYLKGAPAATNGGGTGGAATHTHTSPAHTHTQNAHTHASAPSGNNDTNVSQDDTFGGAFVADDPHTHAIALNAATATNGAVTTTINASNHEPLFKKLNTILNGGSDSLPTNIIALWGGTNTGIPSGWSRFTSMDGLFLKGANADGESNVTTGGAQTHTHTAANCQPGQGLHNHTGTIGPPSITVAANDFSSGGGAPIAAGDTHTHVLTVNLTRATNQSTAVTIDANTSESAYPPYVRLIFIQFGAVTPSRPVSGLTSYDIGWNYTPFRQRTPEEQHQISRGDKRYMEGNPYGGT